MKLVLDAYYSTLDSYETLLLYVTKFLSQFPALFRAEISPMFTVHGHPRSRRDLVASLLQFEFVYRSGDTNITHS